MSEPLQLTPEEADKLLAKPAPEPAVPEGTLRLYRCYACPAEGGRGELGRDFAAKPGEVKCPKCGLEPTDKRLGSRIVPVVVIHYEPPLNHPNPTVRLFVGSGQIACTPEGDPAGKSRTPDRRAVTCPRCKATQAYQRGDAGVIDPRYDVPIESVDEVGGVKVGKAPPSPPPAERGG